MMTTQHTLDTRPMAEMLDMALNRVTRLHGAEVPSPSAPANDSRRAELRRTLQEIQTLATAVAAEAGLHTLELRGVEVPRAR